MKKLPLLIAFLSLMLGGLSAQQQEVFVLYDASCMLRINYEQSIAQQQRMDYFTYQIPLANGNKLLLETGVEGSVRQNYLPPAYLGCNDPAFSADLAEQINGNNVKVFMLIPNGNEYLIQPVTMGAVMAKQGNLFTYVSPLASFQFDMRNVIIGENLAFNNANARVFFEGRDGNTCGGTYLIRQLMPRNAYPVIDYKINPELGILERSLGNDGTTAVGGVTVIKAVNDIPVANYLANNCGGQANYTAPNSGPVTYGSGVVAPTNPYNPPTTVVPTTVPNSTPQPATAVPSTAAATTATEVPTHVVAKGETLYGISRRYSVSVDQVKEWNNLRGSTIAIGQSLRVGQATFTNNPAVAAVSSAPLMTNRGAVANSNVGAAQPTPYGQVTIPVVTPADQEHIVVAGETVASVALKYGYTESKFREINGLGANEYLRIGQRLKTTNCNCPSSQARAVTSTVPTTYGQGGGVVAPQSYQPAVAAPVGTPIGPSSSSNNRTAPAYTTPSPSAYGSVVSPSPANTRPSTGNAQVIPNVYQPPTGQSMNSLEGSAPAVLGGNNTDNSFGSPVYSNTSTNTYNTQQKQRSVHVVQDGESLNTIARRYNMSVDQLRELNNMGRTDIIIPFQRLYIN